MPRKIVVGAVVAAVLLSAGGAASAATVGYWKMDDNAENTTVADSSGNGHDGTFHDPGGDPNTSAHSVTGYVDSALSFDGSDDYVDIGDVNDLELSFEDGFALSAWIKLNTLPSNEGESHTIISKHNKGAGSREWWFMISKNNDKPYIAISNDGTHYQSRCANTALTTGQWYHVKVTVQTVETDRVYQFYLNGSPDGDGEFTYTTIHQGTASACIGALGHYISSPDIFFDGVLDHVMVVNPVPGGDPPPRQPRAPYEYIEEVGPGREHETITGAVVAMWQNQPSATELGLIAVYPETYDEQINDTQGSGNLPPYCDLVGQGSSPEDVSIVHRGNGVNHDAMYEAGVRCGIENPAQGDNVLCYLEMYNDHHYPPDRFYVQNNVCFLGRGEVIDCVFSAGHGPCVYAHGELDMRGVDGRCEARNTYGASVLAKGEFSITRCDLYPRCMTYDVEIPRGISAHAPGDIDDVNIQNDATCETSDNADGMGLVGVSLTLGAGECVRISDVDITLALESVYNSSQTGRLRVCGVLSGNALESQPGNYPGCAIVRDCSINVTGIEGDSGTPDPGDDGAGVMVDGVCVRAGGTVKLCGNTSISTSWSHAPGSSGGREHVLHNENGTIVVDWDRVSCPGDYYGQIDGPTKFLVKNASDLTVAAFDNFGDLRLKQTLTSGGGCTPPEGSFIIKDSSGDPVGYIDPQGNMCIEGSLTEACGSCGGTGGVFDLDDGACGPQVSVDSSGNLCLGGKLYQNDNP